MESIHYILLLGVALGPESRPTDEMHRRVQAAIQLFHRLEENEAVRIMPCGGLTRGNLRSEADVMEELLIAGGIPENCIEKENGSRTTMENFLNAAALLKGKNARATIVTSDYHVRRSIRTARRAGLKADGYPAPLPHDQAWKINRQKERCYTLDLIMGWQDPGKCRPRWAKKLFKILFPQA